TTNSAKPPTRPFYFNQTASAKTGAIHFVWVPLVLYLASQLWGASPLPTGPVRMYAWVVFVVNSISLTFDIIEAVRWLRGGKEVLGLERI
ncbi:hypothetical protein, partial [Ralstonia pickettii]|uniref:hypothetical protein n=1 Tax=Ralstonia pickettii TaxID=329 RepID=UPI001C54B0B2